MTPRPRAGRLPGVADPFREDGFPGYPRGWFVVSFSDELRAGEVRPLRYFGRDLVLYRGAGGKAHLLDAHCPHLGAHLGVGGRVEGDAIRCPFHAWRFGADGRCEEVPYATRIPPRAAVRAYAVEEHSGLVFAYFDPEGRPPAYRIPSLDAFGAEGWTDWRHARLEVRTHPREIVENVVDIAHFIPVHQTDARDFENTFDGPRAIQRSGGFGSENNAYAGSGYRVEATYHGPGVQFTDFESRGVRAWLVNAHTMVDEANLHLRFGVMLELDPNAPRTERFLQAYVDDLQTGFAQDIAIWEHKRYRRRPHLVDGDGDIGALRRWYGQFYAPSSSGG